MYGNIINWSTALWEVKNMDTYETEYSSICTPSALGLVLIPGIWNITESKKLCLSIRGGMNVISNAENSHEMQQLLGTSTICQNLGMSIVLQLERHPFELLLGNQIYPGLGLPFWVG